ncbi:hypothetical protein BDW22DRAFT_1360147 [Trametopsis cervina]|nr:hypothetical protein BDW22DRAFT_1360147 [Trametopsis cervina]
MSDANGTTHGSGWQLFYQTTIVTVGVPANISICQTSRGKGFSNAAGHCFASKTRIGIDPEPTENCPLLYAVAAVRDS